MSEAENLFPSPREAHLARRRENKHRRREWLIANVPGWLEGELAKKREYHATHVAPKLKERRVNDQDFIAAERTKHKEWYENGGKEKAQAHVQDPVIREQRKLRAQQYYLEKGKVRLEERVQNEPGYVESRRVRMRDHYHNQPDFWRNNALRKKYGITLAEYSAMLVAQGGVCAICHKPEIMVRDGKICDLAVDHNHVTGRIRGLLCARCNLSGGYIEKLDDTTLVELLRYLGRKAVLLD